MRKTLLSIVLVVLACYAGICTYLYASQRAMMYFPQSTRVAPAETDFSLSSGGTTLRGWVVNPGRPAAILYFGGNAESVQRNRDDFARWFAGQTVYLLAYRGYGASDGTPAERALFADALALYDHVHATHPGAPISVMGRSLGTGVASYVASRRPVERLALVTPFDSMANVAQSHYPWLPVGMLVKDRYESDRYLASYGGPVLVVRAGRDQVVGAARTQALVEALPRPPHVLDLPAAGHDSVQAFPAYAQALVAFFAGMQAPPGDATPASRAGAEPR